MDGEHTFLASAAFGVSAGANRLHRDSLHLDAYPTPGDAHNLAEAFVDLAHITQAATPGKRRYQPRPLEIRRFAALPGQPPASAQTRW